jgi:competence protein ComEA
MSDEPSPRTSIAAFLIVTAAVIGGVVLLVTSRPAPVRITINPPAPTATPAPIEVYVTGAVGQPNALVALPAGSRVSDALAAAGGVVPDADLTRVNLAARLRDGDQVHVYRVGEAERPGIASSPSSTGGVIHINRATAEELETLPGIGAVLAQRIVDDREANGAFTSLADLERVSGIGAALLSELDSLIAFD